MSATPAQEYRIAPELRRCCWYVIVGVAVLLPFFYWIARFVQQRGAADVIGVCILFVLIAAAMTWPLQWRLRLDQDGVSRRLFFYNDLWTWTDLASGRINKRYPYTLHDAMRPWGRRRMRLSYMASDDIQEVMAVINRRYQLPPPPDIPVTLIIKYGFRRSATFDDKGIHLLVGDMSHEYLWNDLRHVHFTRMDPVRRDFKNLLIALSDQEIELKLVTHQGGTSPTWRGATAEEINEFMLQHIPSERVDTSFVGQPPKNRDHIERKLHAAEETRRDFTIMMAIFLPLLVAALVWMAIADGVVKAVLMAGITVVFSGSVIVWMYRSQSKHIDKLKTLLNFFVMKDGTPDGKISN